MTNKYLETNNLASVDMVKRSIIELYNEDFLKIHSIGRLGKLFMSIPAQLNSNAQRYSTNKVIGDLEENTLGKMLIKNCIDFLSY